MRMSTARPVSMRLEPSCWNGTGLHTGRITAMLGIGILLPFIRSLLTAILSLFGGLGSATAYGGWKSAVVVLSW